MSNLVLRRSGQLVVDKTVDAEILAVLGSAPDATIEQLAEFLVIQKYAKPAYAQSVVTTALRRLEGRGVYDCHAVVGELAALRSAS